MRIASRRHRAPDVRAEGDRQQVCQRVEVERAYDRQHERRQDETDRVVDEERRQQPAHDDDDGEQRDRSVRVGHDAAGDPLEESSELEVRREQEYAEEKDDDVHVDRGVGLRQRQAPDGHHRDGAEERRRRTGEPQPGQSLGGDEQIRNE